MKNDPHIKTIIYESNGDTESVTALIFRSWENANSWEPLEFSSAKSGYLITSILNLDLSVIADMISLDLCENNLDKAYQDMLVLSDVFSLYLAEEYGLLCKNFHSLDSGTALTICRVKNYISFCEHKQLGYHTRFFDYLLYHGYFGASPDISQVHGVQDMSAPFDEDDILGSSAGDLLEWHKGFVANNGMDLMNTATYTIDEWNRLGEILLVSLCEIERHGHVIRKCNNCGRYFIPEHRSDTIYCNNSSPQDSSMTCKQYGSQRLWYERQKDDELATLSRNILSKKSMLAKRNPDIPEYTQSYDYFRTERKKWKKAIEEGCKTREEYREWLLQMQSQKVIKEAVSGNDRK